MNINSTTTATTLTSCIVMPVSIRERVLGAPVQGGRMAAASAPYAFGDVFVAATVKDTFMGVRAWNPPD